MIHNEFHTMCMRGNPIAIQASRQSFTGNPIISQINLIGTQDCHSSIECEKAIGTMEH